MLLHRSFLFIWTCYRICYVIKLFYISWRADVLNIIPHVNVRTRTLVQSVCLVQTIFCTQVLCVFRSKGHCLFIYSYSFILRIWFDVLRYFRLIAKCVLSTLHTPHYIWPNEYILLLKQDVLMTACVFLPLCASSSCSYGQRPSIPLCIFWLSLKCSWTGFCLRTCLLPAAHVLSLR